MVYITGGWKSIVKVSLKGAQQPLYFLFITEPFEKKSTQRLSALLIIMLLTEQDAVGNISTNLEVDFS